MSTAEMARRIGVSEPTVRKKLARLQEARIIRVTAIADPIDLDTTPRRTSAWTSSA